MSPREPVSTSIDCADLDGLNGLTGYKAASHVPPTSLLRSIGGGGKVLLERKAELGLVVIVTSLEYV